MSLKNEPIAPVSTENISTSQPENRINTLKLAFMYVLIGGLASSALVAILALLIGSFNSAIQNSLLTILIFFSHSLFILALLWTDKHNEVGRGILPTTLFGLALANMITTTLATWDVISDSSAWNALGLYFLLIGGVFILIGILRLFIQHKPTKISLYGAAGAVTAFVLTLVPWVLSSTKDFDPLYFRVVAAVAILASTIFLIAIILRSIALARSPELRATKSASQPISGGLLAIYITIGSIAAMVWCAGLTGFLVSAVQASQPYRNDSYNRYY